MAGNSNIFNADALDVLFEALIYSHGLQLRREEIALEIVSQTAQTTRLRLMPQLAGGTTIYVDPVEVEIRKLNLAGKMPKDMSYSGYFPLTLTSLASYLESSYGLVIRSGEWIFRRNGTEVVVDENFSSNGSHLTEPTFYLRPSAVHPLFEANSFELPILITEPLITGE